MDINTQNKDVLKALKEFPEAKRFFDEPDPAFDNVGESVPSYVYVWYLEDSGTPFYIARGVRNRYKHILWTAKKNTRNGKIFKALQEEHGINCSIPYDNLTFHESKVLAYSLIKKALNEGITLHQNLSTWGF